MPTFVPITAAAIVVGVGIYIISSLFFSSEEQNGDYSNKEYSDRRRQTYSDRENRRHYFSEEYDDEARKRRNREFRNQNSSKCMICLEEVIPSNINTRTLSCSHMFHYDCIEKWFKQMKSTSVQYVQCPVCRANS